MSQVFRYAVVMGHAKHNVAAYLRGALRPRKVTHRAAITESLLGVWGMIIFFCLFPKYPGARRASFFFSLPLRAMAFFALNLEAAEVYFPLSSNIHPSSIGCLCPRRGTPLYYAA